MNCTPVCNNAAVLSASDKEKNMRFLCSILCSKRRCTAQTEHILCSKKGHGQCVWVFFYRSIQRRVKRMALAACGESCFAREERRPRVKGVFWFLLLKGGGKGVEPEPGRRQRPSSDANAMPTFAGKH